MSAILVDTSTGSTRNNGGVETTSIYRLSSGHKVRVRYHFDPFYRVQSYAVAAVLTAELTWTTLCDSPHEAWWKVPGVTEENVIADLVARSERILLP